MTKSGSPIKTEAMILNHQKTGITSQIIKHLVLWAAYILYNATKDLAFHADFVHNIIADSFECFFTAVVIYTNLYILIPKYLVRKRYALYFSFLVPITAIFTIITAQSLFRVLEVDFFGSSMGHMAIFLDNFVLLAITTAFDFVSKWYERDNYAKELEKQNVEAELSLLKNTINPHFLFNSLNSIYFLIKKNTTTAQKILLELSDMLSHQLYDCKDKYISLSKEIEYLQNYISIENIRQSDIVVLDFNVEGDIKDKKIAPMLLLPFVENAFKYGFKSGLTSYKIEIDINVTDDTLHFGCKNEYKRMIDPNTKKGIGLSNVKRRLELIYPNQHELNIKDNGNLYEVKLEVAF